MSEELQFGRIFQDAYEGATENYRLGSKGLLLGDQDNLSSKELKYLQARSHHAVRNFGWAKAAKTSYRVNQGAVKIIWKKPDGDTHKMMQGLWEEFAENPSLDNYGNMETLQDIWNAGMFESGEIFARILIDKNKKTSVPLSIQTLESEFLDPEYNDKDKNIKHGLQFKNSIPVTYWFFKKYPGNLLIPSTTEKIGIPADEILHSFIRERAGQWRGVPILCAVLLALYELEDLTDATVAKQKAAQALSWLIQNTNPEAGLAVGTAVSNIDKKGNKKIITQANGSGVHYLNKGETVVFAEGEGIGNNLNDLLTHELHKFARGVGQSYINLTGDISNISFSGLKYITNEAKVRAEHIYKMYTIPLMLAPLCKKFKEIALLTTNKNISTAIPTYRYPRRPEIDALKDTQADVLEIISSLDTLENKLSERGLSYEEIVKDENRRKKENIEIKPAEQTTNVKPNSNSTQV